MLVVLKSISDNYVSFCKKDCYSKTVYWNIIAIIDCCVIKFSFMIILFTLPYSFCQPSGVKLCNDIVRTSHAPVIHVIHYSFVIKLCCVL